MTGRGEARSFRQTLQPKHLERSLSRLAPGAGTETAYPSCEDHPES